MALFDKLKDKVGNMVDVDKLSEMANKTVASVKQEVAKAIDPSIKEQERLEKEKAAAEKAAAEKAAAEKAIEDFWASNNLDEELDYIFSVLEKNGATASNFEKGIEHFFSKVETILTKEEIFSTMKKALFVRAFDNDNCTVAKAVAVDYFIQNVVKDKMLYEYMRFAIAKEKGDVSGWMASFVKVLYGVAGHAYNYQFNRKHNNLQPESYQAITQEAFKTIIEVSDVLKSYTDSDPFAIEATREKWANDLYDSTIKLVRSSKLGNAVDQEKDVDALCYFAYTVLRKDQENSGEDVSVPEIAFAYADFLKGIYDRTNH